MAAADTSPRAPLTREAWIGAALHAVAEGGAAAVAVEPLAARLGATKGSFYWHFRNREELIREALAHWEREATDAIIEELAPVGDPVRRLRLVLEFATQDEDDLYPPDVALLASARDPVVGPVVARVQRKRLAFLERCFRDLGLPPAESRHRSRVAYSAYLGWFQQTAGLPERPSARELAAYRRVVLRLLTR